ncbi:hypothetical protein BC834DRAFT_641185 [Gloeopeniophorella convolvens]|nr:hypothetical protein BC834DRAFT_641185 [Gloeopeniophorella convolvens]
MCHPSQAPRVFPWTEPIRLRFTSDDPLNTTLVHERPSSPTASVLERPPQEHEAVEPDSPQSPMSIARTARSDTLDRPGDAAGPSRPIFVVETRARRRWPGGRETTIRSMEREGDGRLATISWSALKMQPPRVVLGRHFPAKAEVRSASLRKWLAGCWHARKLGAPRGVLAHEAVKGWYTWNEGEEDLLEQLVAVRDGYRLASLKPTRVPLEAARQGPSIRLRDSSLELRAQEEDEARVQLLLELCVVSATIALSRREWTRDLNLATGSTHGNGTKGRRRPLSAIALLPRSKPNTS